MKWTALFSTLLLSPFVLAAQDLNSTSSCSEYYTRAGAFSYQRFESTDGTCFLGVDPFEINNFVYRSYLSTNDGIFMVFNSYSASEGAGTTGARVFYFFPRNRTPEMKLESSHSELQTPTPGIDFQFSLSQSRILGMTGGKVKEASKVSPSNKGGVEFESIETLYLDAGFSMDHDPTTEPNKSSRFIDRKGQVCKVLNKEIFKFTANGGSEFQFSDSELKSFLSKRCPKLEVNF